jgi:type IV pilus assembly protein PilX
MKRPFYQLNQNGAALITGLLILVVLSILGVTTMQSSLLQERMAGNMEQRDIAFEMAEAGLRDGEAWLNAQVVMPLFNGSGWRYGADSSLWSTASTWTTPANRRVYSGGGIDTNPYTLPLYYMEYMADIDNSGDETAMFGSAPEEMPGVYRVTSRGESPNAHGVVILQTTFIR